MSTVIAVFRRFQTLVCIKGKAGETLTDMTGKIINVASLSTEKRRPDSTQINQNMVHLSRPGLFTCNIEGLL